MERAKFFDYLLKLKELFVEGTDVESMAQQQKQHTSAAPKAEKTPMNECALMNYTSITEAIATLFHPYVEAVIQSRAENKIIAIHSPTLAAPDAAATPSANPVIFEEGKTIHGPYLKMNADGSFSKSISIALTDAGNHEPYVLSLSIHLAVFAQAKHLLAEFMSCEFAQAREAFQFDWQEKVRSFVTHHLEEKHLTPGRLTTPQRKSLVKELSRAKVLGAPNAHKYVAEILGVSRATIFNDLKS